MFAFKYYSLLILHILAHIETFFYLWSKNVSYFVLAFFVFFFFSFVANIFKNFNYSRRSLYFLFFPFILNFINVFFIKSDTFSVFLLYLGLFAIFNRFFVIKTVTILPLFQKQKSLNFIVIFLICFIFSIPCLFKSQINVKSSSVYYKADDDIKPVEYDTKEISLFNRFGILLKKNSDNKFEIKIMK